METTEQGVLVITLKRKVRTAEIFCGAGLLGATFKRRRCEPVFAADADPRAVASFNRNVAAVAEVWDARKVKASVRCEIVLAGPPCQGFSTLGRRDPRDERNALSLAIVDWAATTGAKVVVIENVPQFLDSAHWKSVRRALERRGFEATAWILNAHDFGAPQLRTRAFAILSKHGLPVPPKSPVAKSTTVRDAFHGLRIKADNSGMHVAPEPSPIARARFRHIPPCGDKRDILKSAPELCPPSWTRVGVQATDVWGRMDYDSPANTLRCCFQNASKGRYVHPVADRVITLREGARLQGVPDDWEFYGDRTSVARQIGNGVPFPLGAAVAGSILELFN